MPAKGFLSSEQEKRLQFALKESDSSVLTQRILILLLLNDGKTYQQISDFIGCSYRTVAYWCVHGDPDKLESLRDQREQGNYHKATEAYVQRLMEVIEIEPQVLGYEFGRWTTARFRARDRHSVEWRTGAEDFREKKVRLPLGKI